MSVDNKAVVQRFYDEVVNNGNLALADELLSSEYVEHGNPSGSGITGFRNFVTGLAETCPDLRLSVEDVIAEGDKVVARVVVRATHQGVLMGSIRPTGRQVAFLRDRHLPGS